MKIRFIINPIAGTGKQRNIEEHIAKYLKDYDIIYTKNPGDARKISNDAVKKKIDLVIVVGGDGTINECLKSIINTNTAQATQSLRNQIYLINLRDLAKCYSYL